MDVSDARGLKALEDENARLKKLLAEQMLDNAILKDVAAKMYGPPRQCKVLVRDDEDSLRKCIRPLASGLLLQSGHDEIRAHRSQTMVRAEALFLPELTVRRSAVSSSSSNLAIQMPRMPTPLQLRDALSRMLPCRSGSMAVRGSSRALVLAAACASVRPALSAAWT
jgi:hypothetical protein